MAGTGQRHVEEAEVLAATLLELHLLMMGEAVPFVCRRRSCAGCRWSGSWNIGTSMSCRGRPSHMYGQNTIGNSSPLLRWIVITCTASASDSRRRARSSFSPSRAASWIRRPSHVAMAVGPEALGHAGLVQQLGDVAQVRHEPLARRARQHPLGHVVRAADRLVERGDALLAQQRRPAVQRPVQALPLGFVRRGHLFGRPAHEAGQRRQRGAVPCRRAARAPRGGGATPSAGLGGEDGAGSADHRRDARRRAARRARSRPGCSPAPARRCGPGCSVVRPDSDAVPAAGDELGAVGQQLDHLGRQVPGDEGPRRPGPWAAACSASAGRGRRRRATCGPATVRRPGARRASTCWLASAALTFR